MKYNPDIHHRRSIRLKGYDYSQNGAYFVTICTHNRECMFGKIVNNEMTLNDYGKIVYEEWFLSAKIRNEIRCRGDRPVAPTKTRSVDPTKKSFAILRQSTLTKK